MDKIKKVIEFLKGKKTYAIAIGGGILFALQLAGVPIPNEVWQLLGIGGLASLRAAVAKVQ